MLLPKSLYITHAVSNFYGTEIGIWAGFGPVAKLYIPSTPNNSNETHTFMCLGRTGRFGQH